MEQIAVAVREEDETIAFVIHRLGEEPHACFTEPVVRSVEIARQNGEMAFCNAVRMLERFTSEGLR